ncbi:hypothetical protein AA98_3121 [Escherichia coli 2-011-08_S1_C1]|nr:hypothetical protein AA98_3121 [Escherichia coli 2-011-08_S1_C1]
MATGKEKTEFWRVPRASGDKPETVLDALKAMGCSPRQRG